MGLFNDFIKGASDIFSETKKAIKEVQDQSKQQGNEPKVSGHEAIDNPAEPLPAIPVQANLHGQAVEFMISKDFTEHCGYLSSVVSLEYPFAKNFLEDDCTISLHEGIGDFDEIAESIEEYLSNNTVTGVNDFVAYPEGNYLFSFKMKSSIYKEYVYVFRGNSSSPYDYDMLLLFYPDEISNTNLEKKLISCFEETVKSLKFIN